MSVECFLSDKNAREYSLLPWIIFLFIFLGLMTVMVMIYVFLAGGKLATGEGPAIEVVVSDKIVVENIIGVFNEKVFVDSKEQRIGDLIIDSLSPYFEIKNDEGISFVDKFGVDVINEPFDSLKGRMLAQGFDEDDWKEFGSAKQENQEGEYVAELVNRLNKFCDKDRWDSFLMETPQGILTKNGLKLKEALGSDLFFNSQDKLNLYTPTTSFKIYYYGKEFEIKYRQLKDCW